MNNPLAGLDLVYKRSREKLIKTFSDPNTMYEMDKEFKDRGYGVTADDLTISFIRSLDTLYEGLTSEFGMAQVTGEDARLKMKKVCTVLMLESELSMKDIEIKMGIEEEYPGYTKYPDDPLGVSEEALDVLLRTMITLENIRGII